jgi:fatty acid synthase, animal type
MKILVVDHFQTEENVPNLLSAHICTNFFSTVDENFIKKLWTLKTWQEKVELMTSVEQNLYGKEYLKLMATALINRIKFVFGIDAKVTSTLSCTSTLIRPSKNTISNIDEAYNLDENFKKKVEVTYLEGNHFSILENPDLINLLHKINIQVDN